MEVVPSKHKIVRVWLVVDIQTGFKSNSLKSDSKVGIFFYAIMNLENDRSYTFAWEVVWYISGSFELSI